MKHCMQHAKCRLIKAIAPTRHANALHATNCGAPPNLAKILTCATSMYMGVSWSKIGSSCLTRPGDKPRNASAAFSRPALRDITGSRTQQQHWRKGQQAGSKQAAGATNSNAVS